MDALFVQNALLDNFQKSLIDVRNYGTIGDGVADDTIALRKAAIAARNKKKTLFIPSGVFRVTSKINFYSPVLCYGKILVSNNINDNAIKISRITPSIAISGNGLAGFNSGSSVIDGLRGYVGGTLVLKSTDLLIVRDKYPEAENYTCNEALQIKEDGNGGIYPPLDCVYSNLSNLSMTVYPYEEPIAISGLWVESEGDSIGTNALVWCNRSNVLFDNLIIKNNSLIGYPSYGFLGTDCTDITLNDPTIINFFDPSYGLCFGIAANITVNDGNIKKCYHALSGRHVKNVSINGGTWDRVIDCHWGSDYKIDGATIYSQVQFAGTNIGIKNCLFKDCPNILKVRNDTPELIGEVVLDNLIVEHSGTGHLLGINYPDYVTYGDFGRPIRTPNSISITKISAKMVGPTRKFYVLYKPYKLAETNTVDAIGEITISGISVDKGGIIEQYPN